MGGVDFGLDWVGDFCVDTSDTHFRRKTVVQI